MGRGVWEGSSRTSSMGSLISLVCEERYLKSNV